MSLGFGPRRFPTSTLTSKLSSDAYVRGVVACPAVSASSLMRNASATRRARTLHSSAKSNVRRETVKKTRRQNTNCPYENKKKHVPFTEFATIASYTSMARATPTFGLFLHTSMTAK